MRCEQVYLHVQTNNDDAVRFYKKHGYVHCCPVYSCDEDLIHWRHPLYRFSVTGEIKNYYKRIEPPDCFVLSKSMAVDAPAESTA